MAGLFLDLKRLPPGTILHVQGGKVKADKSGENLTGNRFDRPVRARKERGPAL